MSILGYLREASADEFPQWARQGRRVVIVDALLDDQQWQLADQGRRCRFMSGRKGCGRPAVVQLLRRTHYNSGVRYIPWGYCDDPAHLFGRRWVDGRLESAKVIWDEVQA